MDYHQVYRELTTWLVHLGRISIWVLLDCVCLFVGLRYALLGFFSNRIPASLRNSCLPATCLMITGGAFLLLMGGIVFTLQPDQQFQVYLAEKASLRGDYEAVLDAYAPLIATGTKDVSVYKDCAICAYHLGRYQETITFFQQAQNYGADKLSPNAYLVCALAYEQLGQPAQAAEQLRRALSKPFPEADKARLNEQLQRLQNTVPANLPQ